MHDRINILQTTSSSSNRQPHGIDIPQCRRIIQTAEDFFKRIRRRTKNPNSKTENRSSTGSVIEENITGVLLAFAYPDRIARQRNKDDTHYLLSNGKGAVIPEYLQHHLYEFLVIASLDAKQREASIYLAAEISAQQLQDYFSEIIKQTEEIKWNDTTQRVEAKSKTCIGQLTLEEKTVTAHDNETVRRCLLQAIKAAGLHVLNWSEQADSLKQRVQFINQHVDNDPTLKMITGEIELPDFSETGLLDTLSDWLQPYLTDENSFKQCQKLDTYKLLVSQLSWEQQQLIDRLAPEKITVPSGSAIRIDYSEPKNPVLAVRLQEVFGLHETPAILNGHCKLMMHLLSPAHRPMQVTQDLHSFWKTTYHEVKKELRGKYKKHYWPDDPLTAQATSKTKKQMNS